MAALTPVRPRALMIAPAVPGEIGNGLAMRLGLFLEAFARVAEVDLAVLPVAGAANEPTALLGRLGITPIMLPCDRPDTRFALLSRLELRCKLGMPRLVALAPTVLTFEVLARIAIVFFPFAR